MITTCIRNPKTGKNQAVGPHSPAWCPEMLKSGAIPARILAFLSVFRADYRGLSGGCGVVWAAFVCVFGGWLG